MLLKEYREQLLDLILNFLWREWSALGVLGQSAGEERWVIDPEPLLVFSLQLARYEPRLFDEILAWLETNGKWLDVARLRHIIRRQDENTVRVVGGSVVFMLAHGNERKWLNLAKYCEQRYIAQPAAGWQEVLFKEKSGKDYPPAVNNNDPDFLLFEINRQKIHVQKEAREVPVNASSNLRFMLRALFGVGGKSEILLYLMTHEAARPKEIAADIGLFWLGVQQTVSDMSKSGLVLTRQNGKRLEYRVLQNKWWEFVSPGIQESSRPKWLDWNAIFAALYGLWTTVDAISDNSVSEYMKGSRLQDSLEKLAMEFGRAGIAVGNPPSPGLPPELQQAAALNFISGVLGATNG